MKCPKCGYDKIQPNYKFCPKCRTSLTMTPPADVEGKKSFTQDKATPTAKSYRLADPNDGPEIQVRHAQDDHQGNRANAFGGMQHTISEQVAPRVGNEYETGSLEFVKNKAIWKIEKGEIARHITPREIDNLDNLDGVIVEDGVTAIIEVDGEVVAELHGGVYNFATVKTVEEAHKKIAEEKDEKNANLGVIGHIKKAARTIGRFLFGRNEKEVEEERIKKEKHYKQVVRRITDKSVVSIYLKADRAFPAVFGIVSSTGNNGEKSVEFEPFEIRTKLLDIQVGVSMQLAIGDFNDFITNYMTGNKSVTISDVCLSVNPFLRSLLQNALRTADITESSFSEPQIADLTQKIKNLESILPGLNIINVLEITTDNEDLERFRAVERDLYTAERELDYLRRTNEFKNRLAEVQYQQVIVTARNELDYQKILDEVNKDGLIHADEMEAFVQLLTSQKRIREAKTETEEEKALLELKGNRLVNEDDYAALEDAIANKQFERAQVAEVLRIKSLANTEKLRQESESDLALQKLKSQIELDRTKSEYVDEKDIREADKEKTILGKKLEAQEMVDDYAAKVADRDYDREKRKQLDEFELLKQKAALARANMEAMKEQARKDKEMDYAHEDKAGERELERERIRATLSADQIAAAGLKDLDAAAQAEFMRAMGSGKETELLKQTSADREALLREMMKMQQESSDKSSDRQMELIREMMDFAKSSNATTASVVGGVVAAKAQGEKELRESMERVATKRIGEVDDMKKEYQDELHKEQKRTDATQDKALNYTTKITLADAKSSGKAETKSGEKRYIVEGLGNKAVSFEVLSSYISNGVVIPSTEITVDGDTMLAVDIEELFPILAKHCSVKCPNCGETGLRGLVCPECGNPLE